MRSMLFVPGSSPQKFSKAMTCGADAVIFDLEDSVLPALKAVARAQVAQALGDSTSQKGAQKWVRINALAGQAWEADLDAILPHDPEGLLLPKCHGAGDVRRLGNWLRIHGSSANILALVTETPRSVLKLADYLDVGGELAGVSWGGEDLAAALGAKSNKDEAGQYLPMFISVRNACLLTAAAIAKPAIDAAFMAFRDLQGLKDEAEAAARDGFRGKLAIHPAQVPVINAAFTPSETQIEAARSIVAAFAASPEAGAIEHEGRMLDRPHLQAAEQLLAAHKSRGQTED